MKIFAFHNCKGGVATTTLAAIAAILPARAGLRVVGASLDPNRELRCWLNAHGVPWVDALDLQRPALADLDLLVLDVRATSRCVDVLRPDLWVVPMDNRTAYENAVAGAPQRVGPELWVWSLVFNTDLGEELRTRFGVPEELRARVRFAAPMIVSDADIGAAVDELQVPEDAGAAKALHTVVREALALVGLDLGASRATFVRRADVGLDLDERRAESAAEISTYVRAHAKREQAARERLERFFAA